MNLKRLLVGSTLVLSLLSSAGVSFAATGGITSASVQQELAAVRQATAKYHDVNQALADGYVPVSACTAEPGLGGMGIHYLNPNLAGDLEFDPQRPELLLYEPTADGLKLVGVEYFAAYVGQPTPELFGQKFDGPMPGHEPGMPVHYDLHAWLWEANPNGTFTPYNPNVRCP